MQKQQPQHTPGEWKAEQLHGVWNITVPDTDGTTLFLAAVNGDDEHMPSVPCNARIMAAAPDMLNALKTIENDSGQVPAWLWDLIQAAIAKAEGRAADREISRRNLTVKGAE